MKVLALKRFSDKYDEKTRYQPGEVVDFSEDRAKSLVERGLGVLITDESGEAGSDVEQPVFGDVEPTKFYGMKPEADAKPETDVKAKPKAKGK